MFLGLALVGRVASYAAERFDVPAGVFLLLGQRHFLYREKHNSRQSRELRPRPPCVGGAHDYVLERRAKRKNSSPRPPLRGGRGEEGFGAWAAG